MQTPTKSETKCRTSNLGHSTQAVRIQAVVNCYSFNYSYTECQAVASQTNKDNSRSSSLIFFRASRT